MKSHEPSTDAAARNPVDAACANADRLLVADEVADMLAVPTRWVRSVTREGTLPAIRLGRYVRYDRADVLAWVEAQKTGGTASGMRPPRLRAVEAGGRK